MKGRDTMRTYSWFGTIVIAAAISGSLVLGAERQEAQGTGGKEDPVAALKKSMQQGMAKIRTYEWIETTIISVKGEEKARKQNRCYYGADGKVQKVAMGPAPAAEQGGGGGGRKDRRKEKIVENKKDEMQEYMERSGALVQQYVPPSPEKIQAAKDAGRVAVNPPAAGVMRLVISDYLQKGDSVTVEVKANQLAGLGVNTYLDKVEDAVTLAVKMNTLPDGALYAAETTLEAKAKNIRVVIQNSGHKPLAK